MPRRGAVRFKLPVVVPPDIDGLPPAELRQLLLKLLEENAELQRQNAELHEEIARLKGLKGRPSIKPSGMENGTSPKPGGRRARRRGRGKVAPRVEVEEQILKAEVPEGSRFKGYEDFVGAGPRAAGPGDPLSARALGDPGWSDGDRALAA